MAKPKKITPPSLGWKGPLVSEVINVGNKKVDGTYKIELSIENFKFEKNNYGQIVWIIKIPKAKGDWVFDRRPGRSPITITPPNTAFDEDVMEDVGDGKVLVVDNRNSKKWKYNYTLFLVDRSSGREGSTDPSIDNMGTELDINFLKRKKRKKKIPL